MLPVLHRTSWEIQNHIYVLIGNIGNVILDWIELTDRCFYRAGMLHNGAVIYKQLRPYTAFLLNRSRLRRLKKGRGSKVKDGQNEDQAKTRRDRVCPSYAGKPPGGRLGSRAGFPIYEWLSKPPTSFWNSVYWSISVISWCFFSLKIAALMHPACRQPRWAHAEVWQILFVAYLSCKDVPGAFSVTIVL